MFIHVGDIAFAEITAVNDKTDSVVIKGYSLVYKKFKLTEPG